MAFNIQDHLSANLNYMHGKIMPACQMYLTTKASTLKAQMQHNRPWRDRTGMAKALLDASVSKVGATTLRMTLSHGVQYGIWLELAREKKYAILWPTINLQGPKLIEGLTNIMSKIAPTK